MDAKANRESQDDELSQAMELLWVRFLPQIMERVAALEVASAAAATGTISKDGREAAHAAAHKLAGTLGMFNLMRGTDLARNIEVMLAPEGVVDRESSERLASLIAKLRAAIESRKPSS